MYAVTKEITLKFTLAVIVLKNRSNKIRSNEIRIRREPPVVRTIRIEIGKNVGI